MVLGIDIGSSSSKAVILDGKGTVLAAQVVNLGTGTRGVEQVVELAHRQAGTTPAELRYTVATGYGRMTYPGAQRQVTELSCHARGIHHLFPQARTVVDIGGQDAKVLRLDRAGGSDNFVMNDKCAAGTGRFLEVMARVLDCPIGELSRLAGAGDAPVPISNMCTVFAESEVISHLAANVSPANVAAGAIRSIAARIAGMAGRAGVEPEVIMTGGGALNRALVEALSEALHCPIRTPPEPQLTGALGAALFALDQVEKDRN